MAHWDQFDINRSIMEGQTLADRTTEVTPKEKEESKDTDTTRGQRGRRFHVPNPFFNKVMTAQQRRHFLSLPDFQVQQDYYESLKKETAIPDDQTQSRTNSGQKDDKKSNETSNPDKEKKGPTSTPNWKPSAYITQRRFAVH